MPVESSSSPAWRHGQLGLFGAAAVAICGVDLTSKALATTVLNASRLHLNPALSLGHAPYAPEVQRQAAGAGIAVFCLFAWWCIAVKHASHWPLAALLGGALGNFVDHLEGGGIVDFMRVGNWVFNLADVAVLAGLGGATVLGVGRARRPVRAATGPGRTAGSRAGVTSPTDPSRDPLTSYGHGVLSSPEASSFQSASITTRPSWRSTDE